MYTQTRIQIVEIIRRSRRSRIHDIVQTLGITPAAVHRAVKKLCEDGTLVKYGKPPKVFYGLKEASAPLTSINIEPAERKILNDRYLYVSPDGNRMQGIEGFLQWMRNTNNKQKIENCVRDYLGILKEADSHKNKNDLIPAHDRFKALFYDLALSEIYYFDFYSLIKFGKTKVGQLLHYGKSAQNKKLISEVSDMIKPSLKKLVASEKFDAVLWVPHSLPRSVQFLKELEAKIDLDLPKIKISKVFAGDIPVAQKSLSKIQERIDNANSTMILDAKVLKYKKVLVIDDAVGSGATLNEVAKKLREKGIKEVVGFAVVGSYKGFEVIKEI